MKKQIIIDLRVEIYKLQEHNKWLSKRIQSTSSASSYQRYTTTFDNNKAKILALGTAIKIVENA